MSYRDFKSRPQRKKQLTSDDIKSDLYLSKFAIRVFFTEFALDWQLKTEDNFSTSDLTKCKKLFEELGYISTGVYSELSESVRECLYLTNPNIERIDRVNPICYRRTNNFFRDCKDFLMDEIIKQWKDNESILTFYQKLVKKHQSMKIIKENKHKEELELEYRTVRTPDKINYDKPTLKLRNNDIAFLEARAELLHEGKILPINDRDKLLLQVQQQKVELLSSVCGSDLIVIDEDKKSITKSFEIELIDILTEQKNITNRITTQYKGLYEGLHEEELELLSEPAKITKNYKKDVINEDISKKDRKELNSKYESDLEGTSLFTRKINMENENKKCDDLFNELEEMVE